MVSHVSSLLGSGLFLISVILGAIKHFSYVMNATDFDIIYIFIRDGFYADAAISFRMVLSEKEKVLFEKLISVSGIGPRLAVTLLSGLEADELTAAIRRGDVQRLVRVPGVGRKTGERLVLELREKVEAPQAETLAPSRLEDEVISALLNLGCARPAAEAAVEKARRNGAAEEFEPMFRAALQIVMK